MRQVDVPSFSGSFGILPSHVPSLAVLKSGVITVHEHSGEAKKIFVSSGSVTINQDSSGMELMQCHCCSEFIYFEIVVSCYISCYCNKYIIFRIFSAMQGHCTARFL